MKRRIVALLLALVMALGLAMPASATGLDGTADPTVIGGAGESVVITGDGVTTAPTTAPPTGDSTTTAPPAGDSTTTVPPAGDSTPTTTPATLVDGEDESATPAPLLGTAPLSGGTPVVTAVTTTAADVPYLDATGASKTCPSATVMEAGTDPVTWNSGWYVVNDNVVIDDTVTVEGDVHLILADGAELTVNGKTTTLTGYAIGFKLLGSLTIYAQSAAGENIGKLTITAADVEDDSSYGIEITSAGSLTANGGVISATGGNVVNAATWSSGSFGIAASGPATINGGTVTATGGGVTGMFGSHGIYVNSDVTIKGGTVTATGGKYGIGGEIVKFESGTLVAKGAGTSGKAIEAESVLPDAYYWRTAASDAYTPSTTPYAHNDADTYVELTTRPSGGGYIPYKKWDTTNKKLVDDVKATSECSSVPADPSTNGDGITYVTWDGGETGKWYYVEDAVNISNMVNVTGNVHLILKDGAALTVTRTGSSGGTAIGIQIDSGASLTIYGQDKQTGTLESTATNTTTYGANGILIKDSSGSLTINGGTVTGACNSNGISFGISVNGTLTVNGGTLIAKHTGTTGKAVYKYGETSTFTPPAAYWWRTSNVEGTKYNTQITYTADALTGEYFELTTTKPAASLLDRVGYLDWDGSKLKTELSYCESPTPITTGTTALTGGATAETAVWYYVKDNVTITGTLTVTGYVNLILCDGKTLTVTGGIKVGSGNVYTGITTTGSLTIYAQSIGENAGRLTVSAGSAAVIGIQVYCSSLTVNGGVVEATGKEGDGSNSIGIYIAGSSGNSDLSHSSMTVNSGTVTAIGKDRNDSSTESYGIRLENGTPALTINGGEVTATGGNVKSGGSYGISNCIGGSLTINGGTVTATGGTSEAGSNGIYNNPASTLTFNGGTLIAKRAADRNDAAVYLFEGATLNLPAAYWWRTSNVEGTKYNTQNTYTADALGGEYFEITTKKPAAINADTPVPYLVWDSTEETLVEMKNENACTEYTLVKSGGDVTWNEGWYVVKDEVTINGNVTINGEVHLILCDGAKLTVTGCIEGDTLSVHGQSTGDNVGKMTVKGATDSDSEYAWSYGISLDELYLHGSDVTACCKDVSAEDVDVSSYAVFADYVIVYGGSLSATAGDATSDDGDAYSYGIYADEYLLVLGGVVEATGGDVDGHSYACSIGIYAVYGVDVHGGKITATGGEADTDDEDAESYGIYVDYGDLSVYDAEVTATGGDASGYYRYSEAYSRGIFAEDDVYIKDSVVKAYGGDVDGGYGGYVGYVGTCGIYTEAELAIRNSEVTATGGAADADVDAESCGIYAYGDMTVKGDDTVVTATGGDAIGDYSYSYGIYVDGYYDDNEYEYYGDLTIEGGTVNATGGDATGGDDAESYGIYVDDEDMTIEGEDTVVTATGGDATGDDDVFSYGIYVDDDLTIENGKLTATGGDVDGNGYAYSYGIYVFDDLFIKYGTVIAETTADGCIAVYYCDSNKMPDHYENNWWWRTAKNDPFRVHPDFYAGNAAALEEDYFELVTTEPEFIYGEQTPDTDTDHTDAAPDGAPIRRQNNAVAALVPSVPDKADVTSPETFDAGIAVYVGLGVLSLTGSAAWVGKRKKW